MRLNSRGNALPITEITPTAPKVMSGKVIPSSPEMTSKSLGLFLMMSSICEMLPEASLMATMFSKSRARRRVVLPSCLRLFFRVHYTVLPGASVALAIAL